MGLAKLPQETRIFDLDSLPSTCSECGTSSFVEDPVRGEYACMECGLVQDGKMFESSDRRAYTQEEREKRGRTAPEIEHSTVLGKAVRESPEGKQRNYILQRTNTQQTSLSSTLVQGEVLVSRLASHFILPKGAVDYAKNLFKKAQKDKLLRGSSVQALSVACIYYSSKKHRHAINTKKLIDLSGAPKKTINDAYRDLVQKYGQVKILSPVDYVPYTVNTLAVAWKDTDRTEVEKHAINTLKAYYQTMKERGTYLSYDPKSMASMAVYYAANDLGYKVTQRDVAAVYGITEATLRSRAKQMIESLDLEPLERKGRGRPSKDS